MEFWLSGSPSHELFFFHDGILAIKEPFARTFFFSHDGILAVEEPFTRTFLFSRWNFGYRGAFHTNFSFFTMKFWLWRSLSHELFSFLTIGFWLSRSLSYELFFFHEGFLAIRKPFTRTFLFSRMGFSKCTIWGKTLFIYIYASAIPYPRYGIVIPYPSPPDARARLSSARRTDARRPRSFPPPVFFPTHQPGSPAPYWYSPMRSVVSFFFLQLWITGPNFLRHLLTEVVSSV
jgi:hypothetical protein